jgi:redox-sensitive bicupin YhaK (pirin superfamily)
VVSGDPNVNAPIRITQDATLRVAAVDGERIIADFAPHRYGYLFVAGGTVDANGEKLGAGDSVRLYDVPQLAVTGRGEVVLWDTPEVAA